jgi:hypothetical protein
VSDQGPIYRYEVRGRFGADLSNALFSNGTHHGTDLRKIEMEAAEWMHDLFMAHGPHTYNLAPWELTVWTWPGDVQVNRITFAELVEWWQENR